MKFELNEVTKEILGKPNFVCGPIAHKLKKFGHKIKPKAEEEQAYVIHWLLHIYFEHGPLWRKKAVSYLEGEGRNNK